ncbi:MAG: sensor histidine kinase [Myxococcota bacterium]
MMNPTGPRSSFTPKSRSLRSRLPQPLRHRSAAAPTPNRRADKVTRNADIPSPLVLDRLRRLRSEGRPTGRSTAELVGAVAEAPERFCAVHEIAATMLHEFGNALLCLTYYGDAVGEDWRAMRERVLASQGAAGEALAGCAGDVDRFDRGVAALREAIGQARLVFRDATVLASSNDREMELLDVHACVAQTLRLTAGMVAGRIGIAFEAKPLPPLLGYPSLLVQALVNLVLNAIDAIDGHGTIRIRAWAEDGAVVIDVRDSGRGLSPLQQKLMFARFYTTKASGQGLGLDTVRRIIDRHGGQIDVDSEPGRGTAFRIRLPVASSSNVGHTGAKTAFDAR